MNREGALCPDGDPEQGMTEASSQEAEHCSPLNSSSSNCRSLKETHQLRCPAAKARICKPVSGKDVAIIILLILVIALIAVLIKTTRTEQQSCALVSAAHSASHSCSPQCPRQWIGYEGKCYFFSKEKRNWTSSQAFCSTYNASLASIEREEKDFVTRIKDEGTYWIGLKKKSHGDNSELKVTGGNDCVYLDNETSSSGCHAELPCICSKGAGCPDS